MNIKIIAFFLFLGLNFTFFSCDNTLNLVEQGEPVPVVYGLLSSIDDEQFIRVEKSFIDPFIRAEEIAQNEDSIYYNNATVTLINKTRNTSYELQKVDASTLGFNREEGFFLTDPNYIYYYDGEETDFRAGDRVRFELKTGENSEVVFSEINLLDTLLVAYPKANSKMSVPTQADLKFQWAVNNENPAELYDINMYIYYNEADLSDDEPEFELKRIKWEMGSLRNDNIFSVKGIDFYKYLGTNLEKDDKYVRTFEYLDVEFIYSGKELTKYIDFINANIGITSSQPLPSYSNLSSGLGLIAERNRQVIKNVFLNTPTLDSLEQGQFTKELGFR